MVIYSGLNIWTRMSQVYNKTTEVNGEQKIYIFTNHCANTEGGNRIKLVIVLLKIKRYTLNGHENIVTYARKFVALTDSEAKK